MPAAAAGGMAPLSIAIRITTTGASSATSSMRAVTAASSSMSRGMGAGVVSARTLGDSMRMASSLIKYTVVGVFINAGKQAIQMARQFELSFSRIKGLVVVTGNSLDVMKQKVLSLAGETSRAPIELADALYYITSAGIKDTVIALDVLEMSAKAAAAGLGTTNTVADAVTSTMNAYGVANMSAARATDVLVATVREGKAEADTFAPALGKVLPIAAAYGASFEDVSAAIASLSRGGLSAGTAAIYVRQTLSQLLKPSKAAIEVLKGVGLSAESIRTYVKDKGLFAALEMLRDKMGGLENAGDFTKVFGNVRALTAVMSLVGPAADENRAIFERLNNSAGDLDYAFNVYAETIDAEFNKRTAEAQRALIELGDSLKPLVSGFLKVTTAITKAAAAIGRFQLFGVKIGPRLVKLAAGIVLVIAVVAMMLKTFSAFVRLGTNLNVMLAGQGLQYDYAKKKMMVYNTTLTTTTTATGTATVATTTLATATGFSANMALYAAKAMTLLMRAMPYVMAGMAIFMAGMMIYNKFFGKKEDEGAKSVNKIADGLEKVNDLLNESVKAAKSEILFTVDLDIKGAKEKITFDKLKEELEEQSPDFIKTVKNIADTQSDKAAVAYVNALAQTKFGGMSSAFKATFINFFLDQLKLDPSSLKATTYRTGNAVSDAAMEASLIATKEITKEGYFGKNIDIFGDTKSIAEGLTNSFDASKAFGQNFSAGIADTDGELSPLIESVKVLSAELETPAEKAELTSEVMSAALMGLSGDFELVGEKSGNLAKVFSDPKNKTALKTLISGTFGETDAAVIEAIYKKIQDGMVGVGHKATDAGLAMDVFLGVYESQKAAVEDQVVANDDLNSSLSALEDRFTDGLSPAVQSAADSFAAATNAMSEFKRGQEALMGISRTAVEAQIAYRDSMRDFAKDAKDSGGNLFAGTKNADEAKSSLLDSMDAVLEVANTFAASGDAEGASQALGEGMAQIIATGMANGLKQEDIQAFFASMNFDESMLETFAGAKDDLTDKTKDIGGKLVQGMAEGIDAAQPFVDAAVGNLSVDTIAALKKALGIKSPSKVAADEIGKPTATGFAMGFKKEMAGNSGKSIQKDLRDAVEKAYKSGGRKGANSFFKNFLEKKGKVEDSAGDFVKESLGRMKDIIGSLADYIDSQLSFRKAQSELAKLINMQRGLDDRKKKAARNVQYSATRFGGKGGAEVTGYEQSKIDDLQIGFEKASRSYAMGRTTYADLMDAEIALFEARAAAIEISDDVLGSENAFIDAAVEVENKSLNLAKATVDVLKAYQDQQEAAANLYINHKELNRVYTDLATASGIASGKLQIGSIDLFNLGGEVSKYGGFVSTVGDFTSTLGGKVITTKDSFDKDFFGGEGVFANIVKAGGDVNTLTKSIGADFTDLAAGLLNTDSQMYKDLASLGPTIFKAIQTSAQNQFDASPLNLKIRVNATTTTSGGGSSEPVVTPIGPPVITPSAPTKSVSPGAGGMAYVVRPVTKTGPQPSTGRAVGGPVVGMKPYMVGERGPEMFVPKVSGTIVTNSALERYTRVKEPNGNMTSSSPNNISVTVNNPVPEAAQDSITRRMKVLANSGMFG